MTVTSTSSITSPDEGSAICPYETVWLAASAKLVFERKMLCNAIYRLRSANPDNGNAAFTERSRNRGYRILNHCVLSPLGCRLGSRITSADGIDGKKAMTGKSHCCHKKGIYVTSKTASPPYLLLAERAAFPSSFYVGITNVQEVVLNDCINIR